MSDYRNGPPASTSLTISSSMSARTTWTLPTTGWTAEHVFGASIDCGVGAAGTNSCSNAGYANIINSYIGSPTLTNWANSGQAPCWVALSAFNYDSPTAGDNVFRVLSSGGLNDRTIKVGSWYQAENECLPAMLSWLSIPLSSKVLASNFGTPPTNWSVDTTTIPGLSTLTTTTSGAPLSITCTGVAKPDPVAPYGYCLLWFFKNDANSGGGTTGGSYGATLDYKFDANSHLYAPLSTSPYSGKAAGASSVTGTVNVISMAMTTAGTHTYLITPYLNSGDSINIIGTGTWSGSTSVDPVWLMGPTYLYNDAYGQNDAYLYQNEENIVNQMQNWGLNVYFVPTRNCMFGNANEIWTGDAYYIHPNAFGATELANCLKNPIPTNPYPSQLPDPTTYGSNTTLSGAGPFNVSPGDQIVTIGPSANAYVYLPQFSPVANGMKTYIIVNVSTTYTLTVSGNYVSPSPLTTIQPNGAAIVYSNGTNNWYVLSNPTGSANLLFNGCPKLTASATLSILVPCYSISGSAPVTLTVPTTTVGATWLIINYGQNAAATITFSGGSYGTAHNATMGYADSAIITVPGTGGWLNYASYFSGVGLIAKAAAASTVAGQIEIGNATATTATAGPGSAAICSTPGYIDIYIGSTPYKIPYCGN
ncbi:MAG: hypothetical protein WB424_16450 [Terracidiphilus sp.]